MWMVRSISLGCALPATAAANTTLCDAGGRCSGWLHLPADERADLWQSGLSAQGGIMDPDLPPDYPGDHEPYYPRMKLVEAIYDEIEKGGGHRNKQSIASQLRQLDGRHGWKLVPVVADHDMTGAIVNPGKIRAYAVSDWAAMLAASPDPLAD